MVGSVNAPSTLNDRFSLLQEVARGGMGAVFRARDAKCQRDVAIKLMTAQRAEAAERFEREALVLSSLKHPAIVQYIDHGVSEQGQPWLAMDWLDGEPLSKRLRAGPLSLPDCLAVTERIASALETAHAAGVVHRDVKPSNLFLVNGEPSRVTVLDFGIARHASGMDEVTATGEVVGTWAYMSPEQAMAQGSLDSRTDLFSLGCVSFECLTGRKAFHARQQTGILAKILLEDPPPPSTINSKVPAALDDLVLRLLSKSPARRPQTAQDLLAELSELGDPAELPVRPQSVPPTGITQQEQRLLSVVLARGLRDPDATVAASDTNDTSAPTHALHAMAEMHGAQIHFLANGVLVVTIAGRGAPTDHAARAARAALALQTQEPNATLALSTGFGVVGNVVPVGVVIDRGVDALVGAKPGEIRVDATTRDLMSSEYKLREADGHHLLEGSHHHDGERRVLNRAVPFVGRRHELATLSALAAEVAEEENCRAALISGPAGSGKSRLIREYLSGAGAAESTAQVWFARCDPMDAGSALSVVRQLLLDGLQVRDADPGTVRATLLEREVRALMRKDSRWQETLALLGNLLDADKASHPLLSASLRDARLMADSQFRAICNVIAAQCRRDPLTIVLEDVHWADSASVALVDTLLRQLQAAPLTVLATARPEVRERFPDLWQDRNLLELRLAPLSNKAAQRIIRSVLGSGVSPENLATIVTRAEGNAFCLEELLRATAEGREELPDTIVGLVQSRLDGLGRDPKRVLRAASVFGERFEADGALALLGVDAGHLPYASILAELENKEILTRQAGNSSGQLRFRHALVRDAAYAMLTEGDRQLGHRLAAEWLQQQQRRDPFTVAEHFRKGGKPERAAPQYRDSAKLALSAGAHERALEHIALALDAPALPELEGTLLALRAEAHRSLGRPEPAHQSAQDAVRLLKPASEGYSSAQREFILAAAQLGRFTEAFAAAKALSTSVADETRSTWSVDLLRVGTALLEGVAVADVDLWLAPRLNGLAVDAASDLQIRAWLSVFRSLRAHVDHDIATYVQETENACNALRELGDARSACIFGMNLGFGMAQVGQFQRAIEVLLEAERKATALGLARTEVQATTNLSYALLCAGDLATCAADRLARDRSSAFPGFSGARSRGADLRRPDCAKTR